MWQKGENSSLAAGAIIKRLLILALPVSCANILVPVTSSIDMLLVPNRLYASGFTVEEATTMFGYLAGMAQPLLMMATIPTVSLAASLVPAVSEAYTLGDAAAIEKKAVTAMKLCCLITVPAAVGMSALAEPISLLLYGTAKASVAIMHTGPAIWFLGMQQITTGILQGMGKINLPMLHMLAGILVKIGAVWILTDGVNNIAGAAWATNINFGLTGLLNILVLCHFGICFKWCDILKIIAAALVMGSAAVYGYGVLLYSMGGTGATIVAMAVAVLIYGLSLFVLGVLRREELKTLPVVKKFIK